MSWDVAVAGGGLAGAAAACRLAEGGRRVVLLEREREVRHKVCGEFVSGDAEQCLEALGLELAGGLPRRLGAVPVERVRLAAGRCQAAADLPFPAWGLSRRRLDGWLLDEARRRGVAVRLGQAVRGIAPEGGGVRLDAAGEAVRAGAALLATGKHDIRGWPRPEPASALIGLKLHLRLDPAEARALQGHVELALFPGGYAGLQPVEAGFANLCLVVTKGRFAALGRDWRRLVAATPHLRRRLAGAAPAWPDPLAISRIPYGYLHRGGGDTAPVYRLGDQAAVIPSFTGDGMAMALRSAAEVAEAVLAGRPPQAYHGSLARTFRGPLRLAGALARASAVPWLQVPLVAAGGLLPGLVAATAARTRAAAARPS